MEQSLEQTLAQLEANQLTELDLSSKNLTATQVIRLAEALKHNQSLTTLDLGFNQLGAVGAEQLSEVLKVNQTLISLNLEHNKLDNATVQMIQETLQTNRERIKSIRNQTLSTLVILLRHAHSSSSTLPMELWEIIMQQLDFPSANEGYRTSHAIANFLSQQNVFAEFNQRLQTQQSFRLIEIHGLKMGASRFSFLESKEKLLAKFNETAFLKPKHQTDEKSLLKK